MEDEIGKCEECGSDDLDPIAGSGSDTVGGRRVWVGSISCRSCGHRYTGLMPWEDE